MPREPLLHGLRVVEAGEGRAVAAAGRALALLGAAVTKFEPPGGDALRQAGPFAGSPGPDTSIPFLALNGGKASAVLPSGPKAAGDAVAKAAVAADVLIAGRGFPAAPYVGAARRANGRLVAVRISPFGDSGAHATWRSSPIVQYAMSCWMHTSGQPDREPLAQAGELADALPGLAGAIAALMGVYARGRTGEGQYVEVSQQEVLALCTAYVALAQSYTGSFRPRSGMPFPMTLVPAASDGWIGINVLTQAQWEALCGFAGLTDLLEDPRFATPGGRYEHAAEITARFVAWSGGRDAAGTFIDAQGWRIPLGYVPSLAEVLTLPPHRDREFFHTVEHAAAGRLALPSFPALVDGQRLPPAPAPALAEAPAHNEISAGAEAIDWVSLPPGHPPSSRQRDHGGPLTGLRIVDLTMWWSGPLTTELCALMGAEVVKVESIQRIDGWRLAARTVPDLGIEGSAAFNGVNLDKLGVTLDLARDEGRAVLRRLVERADVLVENYSARVMGNLSLSDETLRAWNPGLVIVSLPAFGLTGAWSDFVGFAPTIEQLSGLPLLAGYEGGPPSLSGNSLADPTSGYNGALALLAAMLAARRGRGAVRVDLSQLESLASLLAEPLLEQQATGSVPQRRGNRDRHFAPQGCYACAGDDRWVVLTVQDGHDWAALCEVIGRPDLAADPALASHDGRQRAHDAIDAAIADWTAARNPMQAALTLQGAGIAAAPVLDPRQLAGDEHLRERGFFVDLDRAGLGRHAHPGVPFRFTATPGRVTAAAPTLGQHNRDVLHGILGMSEAEVAALEAAGVIGEHAL